MARETTGNQKSDIHFASRTRMCVRRKRMMNLCTKCTNLTFTIPGLTFTPSNLRFKALQVQPLSAALGQAYRSGTGRNRPRRKVRHANRDKGLSSVSVCGRQPPDKDWDNRFWANSVRPYVRMTKESIVDSYDLYFIKSNYKS